MMLDLGNTNIDDAGMEHIQDLTNLHALNLSYTKITDAGLVHLSSLQKLMALGLSHTQITYKGLEHLRNLQNLRILNVTQIRGGDWREQVQGVEALLQIPNLRVIYINVLEVFDARAWKAWRKLLQFYDERDGMLERKSP
jgi:hypothetical protein